MPRDARGRSARLLLTFAVALASLQGCAKPHPPATAEQAAPEPPSDDQELEQLRAGSVTLACGADCAAAWAGSRQKLRSLYDAQDWRALGAAVARIGFEQDLGYFYLGRAAEELRFYDAALTYYRNAVRLSTEGDPAARCRDKSDRCDGVVLPADALPRISITATEQARAKYLASARRNGSPGRPAAARAGGAEAAGEPRSGAPPPQPDAPDAGAPLIDPPPVAR